jgi:hypothetical protein
MAGEATRPDGPARLLWCVMRDYKRQFVVLAGEIGDPGFA